MIGCLNFNDIWQRRSMNQKEDRIRDSMNEAASPGLFFNKFAMVYFSSTDDHFYKVSSLW